MSSTEPDSDNEAARVMAAGSRPACSARASSRAEGSRSDDGVPNPCHTSAKRERGSLASRSTCRLSCRVSEKPN